MVTRAPACVAPSGCPNGCACRWTAAIVARLAARWHGIVHRAHELRPVKWLELADGGRCTAPSATPRGADRSVRMRRAVAAGRADGLSARRARARGAMTSCGASMQAQSRPKSWPEPRSADAPRAAMRLRRRSAPRASRRSSAGAQRIGSQRGLGAERRLNSRRGVRLLDPIRNRTHHIGRDAHRGANRIGQCDAARSHRHRAMPRLVVAHLLDDRAAFRILLGQPFDMAGQMLLDLALGLDDEREVRAVAGDAGREPDRERSGEPQRIQERGSIVELGKSRRGPREMVFLLARCLRELRAQRRDRARPAPALRRAPARRPRPCG